MSPSDEKLVEMFKALSNEVRFEMLKALREEPHYVGELAEKVNRSDGTVSRHLKQMKRNGLVSNRTKNRRVVYRIKEPEVLETIFYLKELVTSDGSS